MATVGQIITEWSGTSGGPGVSTMGIQVTGGGAISAGGVQTAVNAVRSFWDSVKGLLPNELSLRVSPICDQYEDSTAVLVGSATAATPPAPVLGGSVSAYAGGVGIRVDWNTGAIQFGRRVRGRTYLVPAGQGNFDVDGTVSAASLAVAQPAAAALISALSTGGVPLVVWTKPNDEKGRAGVCTPVTNGTVPDKSAILRTRRD